MPVSDFPVPHHTAVPKIRRIVSEWFITSTTRYFSAFQISCCHASYISTITAAKYFLQCGLIVRIFSQNHQFSKAFSFHLPCCPPDTATAFPPAAGQKITFHLTVTSTVTMTVPHRHTLSRILFIAAKPKHCQLSKLLPGKISSRPCHLCTIPSVSLRIRLKQHFKNCVRILSHPDAVSQSFSCSISVLQLFFVPSSVSHSDQNHNCNTKQRCCRKCTPEKYVCTVTCLR